MNTTFMNLSYSKSNKTNIIKVAESLMENSVLFRTYSYEDNKVTFFEIYAIKEWQKVQIERLLESDERLIKAGCRLGGWKEA